MEKLTKIQELLKLIQDNPDLPIVPMVGTEVVGGDDYGCWMGAWGHARIDEFTVYDDGDAGRVCYRDDMDDMIDSICGREDVSEEEATERVKNMEWTKAIIVSIDSL